MLKQRAGSSKKAHPLAAHPLPLSAFAGQWPLSATLEPSRVAVYGDAEVVECGVAVRGGPKPSFLVLQGDVLFVFEARVCAQLVRCAAHAATAPQDRRSLRLRRALWLDGYEVSAPEACSHLVFANRQVEVRHVSEMAPGLRLTLRHTEASNAWRDALTHATARGGASTPPPSSSSPSSLAAQPPAPAAARDASTQADDEAPERAEAEAAHAAAAELAAAEAAQRAAMLTWRLADARAATAAAEHAAAHATARADALAAELAAMRSDMNVPSVIPEPPTPPAAPPSPPSGGIHIDAVQLPGLPGVGDVSPRTPQWQCIARDEAGPATPQAPRKARPAVWPAAAAHAARRSLYRTEP